MALPENFYGISDGTFTSTGGFEHKWPIISPEGLMRARFDLEFGVVRPAVLPLKIDMDPVTIEMPIASASMFLGIPIQVSELCVSEATNTKRWKRLNRPDKVRIRRQTVPGCIVFNDPFTHQKRIVCHPNVFKKIEKTKGVCCGFED